MGDVPIRTGRTAPIRLGMVRLTDAAPLVLAQSSGLFAAEDLDVVVSVEPSWANIADKLAWGLLEGAVMLPPLAIAMALGLRGPPTRLIVPAGISLNGNAITLGHRFAAPILSEGFSGPAVMAARLRSLLEGGKRLRLAVVHAFSTHDLLLRLFLEQGGIDPVSEVDFSVLPPPEMPARLAAGLIDGFCAGAPWGAVAAGRRAGRTVAVTSAIWPNHPEKCFAVNGAWAEANPDAVLGLVRALSRAGLACDRPEKAAMLAELLSGSAWLDVPAPLVAASLPGGEGGEVDRSVFAADLAGVPFPAHAAWFARQMGRWRSLPGDAEARARALYRPDLHAEVVRQLEMPASPAEPRFLP